jgi:TolB-like protein
MVSLKGQIGKKFSARLLMGITFVPAFCLPLLAKEPGEEPHFTVAVLRIQAHTIERAYGLVLTDMLAGRIFRSPMFTLLERNRMEVIMAEHNLSRSHSESSTFAARAGRVLNVEKVITGSISRVGRQIRVELRVVDVSTGSIDLSISRKVPGERSLERTASDLVKKMERYYKGYGRITGKYDLLFSPGLSHGLGDFRRGTSLGYGFLAGFSFNRPFSLPVPVLFAAGFYYYETTVPWIKYFMQIPVEVYAGYTFRATRTLRFIPSLGAGYIFTLTSYDNIEYRTPPHIYRFHFYYNPLLALRLEMAVLLSERWYLTVTPSYRIFFEPERVAHIVAIDFGVRIAL